MDDRLQITLPIPARFTTDGEDLGPVPVPMQRAILEAVLRASTRIALGRHFEAAHGESWSGPEPTVEAALYEGDAPDGHFGLTIGRAFGQTPRFTVTWFFREPQKRDIAEVQCSDLVRGVISDILSRLVPRPSDGEAWSKMKDHVDRILATANDKSSA